MKKIYLICLLALTIGMLFADRSVEGSYITVDPALYIAGSTSDWTVGVYNNSSDAEWLTGISIQFPTGVTVNSSTDFLGDHDPLATDGSAGDGTTITWSDAAGGNGNIWGSEWGYATVNVTIDAAFTGGLELNYTIDGDVWGADPHSISDVLTIDPALDDDLVAVAVSGNLTPTAETASTYSVEVLNQGNNAAANFDVTLYEGEGNMIGSVTVTELAAGATESYEIEWTPTGAGVTYLYGVVDYATDGNNDNNQTPDYPVNVQASGTTVIIVGTGTETNSSIPVNFWWNFSLTQTIYFPEEINYGGLLAAIQYQNSFGTDYAGETIKIYLTHTTQTHLTAGFIPVDTMPVFEGDVAFPSGENDILINFDTPFGYNGTDNLLVTVLHEGADWASACNFYTTEDLNNPNRSASKANDSATYDPANPPESPTLINAFPNVGLYFWGTPTGSLDGYVYGNDREPLVGAFVDVVDTPFSTYTDETGYYTLPYVFVGDHDLTASYFGYYDGTENVTITEAELTTQDINLDHLPVVNVSGHVVTSDTGANVADGEVTLEGYENYDAITDADGMFTVPGVYADQTYTLTIAYEGYETYVNETVAVGAIDLDLGEIIVEEIAISAIGVIAEENHDGDALIVWGNPGGGSITEYVLDDGTYENGLASNPGYELWLGDQFVVDTSGSITGFQIYAEGTGSPELEVDIFDADQNLVGSSDSFTFIDQDWVTITCDNIPFSDEFYAMVHWNMETESSPYMGMDEDGPNALSNYDWYRDDTGAWLNASAIGYQCVFMIRATAMVTGRSTEITLSAGNNNINTTTHVDLQKAAETLTSKQISGVAPILDTPELALSSNSTESSRLLETFTIDRLISGNEDDQTNWLEIATGLTDTSYVDTTWPTVAPGVYKYAVTAIYTNGVEADPAFSNEIAAMMTAPVTINVTTNGGNDAAGAIVTMTNIDGDAEHVYSSVAPTGGSVNFPEVWLGVYDLTVTLEGFETYSQEGINVFDTMTIPVELTEVIAELGTLTGVNNVLGEVYLTWAPTGASNVLLVDDDGSVDIGHTDCTPIYTAIFDEMGIDYTVYEILVSGDDGPDAATMAAYDVVIWECGEQWTGGNTLGANDETNLGTYIDGGGKIIVNGHDYLWDAYSSAGAFSAGQFPYDYLGVASVIQDAYTIGESQGGPAADDFIGATGSYVDGLTVQITDIFSAGREGVYIDDLTPNDNGAVYATCGGFNAGVQTANTIFTTAGLAGLVDGTSTVLEWMTCSMNNLFVARDRAFLGYTITRDGGDIATGVMDMEYTDTELAVGTYEYTVTGVYSSGNSNTISATVEVTLGVGSDETIIPVVTELKGNYPNPFNPTTKISFSVVEAGNVTIDIYNLKGEKVKTLIDGYMNADFYSAEWNGTDNNNTTVSSGVYFYKMKAGRYTSTKKMILMK